MLRDYDAVLGTVPGESLEKSFQILKPKSTVISLVGPPDAAFGRTRDMNSLVLFVLWLLSRKVHRLAKKRDVEYSFLFVHPDGGQLAEIKQLEWCGEAPFYTLGPLTTDIAPGYG